VSRSPRPQAEHIARTAVAAPSHARHSQRLDAEMLDTERDETAMAEALQVGHFTKITPPGSSSGVFDSTAPKANSAGPGRAREAGSEAAGGVAD
jgi:hypothetical protein